MSDNLRYPITFEKVVINDQFWLPRLKTLMKTTIPYCIKRCEDTGRINNFKIAAGMLEGEYTGALFNDSDLYKVLEGAAYVLMTCEDMELEVQVDEIIDVIAKAQREDGYLNTFYILGEYDKRWTDMDKHEMYCAGHMIEAAIAYYRATGKDKLLNTAIRFVDHMLNRFGEDKINWVPGHEEIELALVGLYECTNERKYLDFSNWLLGQRGKGYGKGTSWDKPDWGREYSQDAVPVTDLEEPQGHAVRLMYLLCGMADNTIFGKGEYLPALVRVWEQIVNKKMYITGGIGSTHENEGFEDEYVLPNRTAYCETCASVGMAMWNRRMSRIYGDAKYADTVEKALYNGALSGIALDGEYFFYANPLESDGSVSRSPWFNCACCPSQIARFIPSIGGYIYMTKGKDLIIDQYIESSTSFVTTNNKVNISQETQYPWEGYVKIKLSPVKDDKFKLYLRLPKWCRKFDLKVNGQVCQSNTCYQNGYVIIDRLWKQEDIVEYCMDMPVEIVKANEKVKEDNGKAAIMRGPLVYCIEETDNDCYNDIKISDDTKFSTEFVCDELGSYIRINGYNEQNSFVAVPYHLWCNREQGRMKTWIPYEKDTEALYYRS